MHKANCKICNELQNMFFTKSSFSRKLMSDSNYNVVIKKNLIADLSSHAKSNL